MALEQLVRAAAMGDKRAWTLLARQLWPRLEGWFRSNRDFDSCDLAQDTLIVVWKKLADFEMRSEDEFMAWVHKIAYFMALYAHRQSKRIEKLRRALGQLESPPQTGLSSRLARAERIEQVLREADKLPESYRRAVENRLEGGDARDLAALTGIKWESARGVESRAFARVRKLLRPSTPPPS